LRGREKEGGPARAKDGKERGSRPIVECSKMGHGKAGSFSWGALNRCTRGGTGPDERAWNADQRVRSKVVMSSPLRKSGDAVANVAVIGTQA